MCPHPRLFAKPLLYTLARILFILHVLTLGNYDIPIVQMLRLRAGEVGGLPRPAGWIEPSLPDFRPPLVSSQAPAVPLGGIRMATQIPCPRPGHDLLEGREQVALISDPGP